MADPHPAGKADGAALIFPGVKQNVAWAEARNDVRFNLQDFRPRKTPPPPPPPPTELAQKPVRDRGGDHIAWQPLPNERRNFRAKGATPGSRAGDGWPPLAWKGARA